MLLDDDDETELYIKRKYTYNEVYLIEHTYYHDNSLNLDYRFEYIHDYDCFFKYYRIGNMWLQDCILDYAMEDKDFLVSLLSDLNTRFIKYDENSKQFNISSNLVIVEQLGSLIGKYRKLYGYQYRKSQLIFDADIELSIAKEKVKNGSI